ncbi:MAG: P1 family peptidase [Terriglobia bacterium]
MNRIKRREFNQRVAALAGLGLAGSASAEGHGIPALGDPNRRDSITDVPGIRVGSFTYTRRPTGCTVFLFDPAVTAGVDYDGSAPGSHQGVLLQPVSPIDKIHGLLLTGGGVYGLRAVEGVMRFLIEHKVGFNWGIPGMPTPIVVGGVIADLSSLQPEPPRIWPDAEAAYKACQAASSEPVQEGNVGVGAGATVGKMLQGFHGMKGGLGSASLRLGDAVIGALAVINGVGDIYNWHTGTIVAGARKPGGKGFANIIETMKRLSRNGRKNLSWVHDFALGSTNLIVIATNVKFDKTALTKIAMMASTGAARAINPYHTTGDGDSTFALSTNQLESWKSVPVGGAIPSISLVGSLAADLASEAILRAADSATSVPGWPAARDYEAS